MCRRADLVDLNDVLDHVQGHARAAGARTGFKFEVGTLSRGRRSCAAIATSCVQVLQNLVQNALRYGERGGQVRIEAKHIPLARPAARALRHRRDRSMGPGIAPEHLPRLTERFYRVDVASSREKGGTGLGLAIVKHILNRHRGELAIASKPGKGSTFTVMLERGARKPSRTGRRHRLDAERRSRVAERAGHG